MNNIKTWIICISAFLIISVSLLLWFKVSFVTQPIENVKKIVVVLEPYHGGKKEEINITNQLEIEHMYGLLKETKIIHVNRYPNHLSSLQFDPKFNIEIVYRNGKTDIYSAASSNAIFRRLDTVTSHGDTGYIMGSSEELWEYFLSLA